MRGLAHGQHVAGQVGQIHGVAQFADRLGMDRVPHLAGGVVVARYLLILADPGDRVLLAGDPPFPGDIEDVREQADFPIRPHLRGPGIAVLGDYLRGDGVERRALEHHS